MKSGTLHHADIKLLRSSHRLNPKFMYLRHVYFSAKRRIEFYRMLNTLTDNGVSIQSALTLIKSKFDQIKQAKNPMNAIISDILFAMHTGVPFYHAMAKWVPNQEYVLIESSHQDIPLALKIVIQHAEHALSIRSALTSSLTYPILMFILLVLTLTALSFYIMPNMAKLTPVSNWPPISYNLYLLSNFITQHYLFLTLFMITALIFIVWSLPNLAFFPVRLLLDRFPPWSIYKSYTATSFLIALSSAIKLGSSFNSSIQKLHPISSAYLKRYLSKVKNRLISGSGFGDAIDIGIFDNITLVSLSVFAVTNKLEQGIQYIADHNLEEQKQIIVRRGKLLGYGMMAFVAVMIGWVVLSMYGMQSAVSV